MSDYRHLAGARLFAHTAGSVRLQRADSSGSDATRLVQGPSWKCHDVGPVPIGEVSRREK